MADPQQQLDQLRDVLEHLYDFVALQSHPFAEQLFPGQELSPRERVRRLRRTVLGAIEEMSPGLDVPLRASHARSYSVLNLHYVEGLRISDVAEELAISERQVYRDLRQAERDLLNQLWREAESDDGRGGAGTPSRSDLIAREARRLSGEVEWVDLRALVEGALEAVQPLAREQGCVVRFVAPAEPLELYLDRAIARQALICLLSHGLQHTRQGAALVVTLRREEGALTVEARLGRAGASTAPPETLRHLAAHLGARCTAQDRGSDTTIRLSLGGGARARVLVIDDNKGMVELVARYLDGEGYEVLGAADGAEGLRLAVEETPDVILLDVMMPEQDGWQVLQRLRNANGTRQIPVIVCSVLEEPRLATSLGAARFLAKPVGRDQLLASLTDCLRETV